jgi:hypothetical protein
MTSTASPRLKTPAGALEHLGINDAERTPCERWSRVMGYHRPVSEWNPGKQQEFADREYFQESTCRLGC